MTNDVNTIPTVAEVIENIRNIQIENIMTLDELYNSLMMEVHISVEESNE